MSNEKETVLPVRYPYDVDTTIYFFLESHGYDAKDFTFHYSEPGRTVTCYPKGHAVKVLDKQKHHYNIPVNADKLKVTKAFVPERVTLGGEGETGSAPRKKAAKRPRRISKANL